jgi:hypothetical protein
MCHTAGCTVCRMWIVWGSYGGGNPLEMIVCRMDRMAYDPGAHTHSTHPHAPPPPACPTDPRRRAASLPLDSSIEAALEYNDRLLDLMSTLHSSMRRNSSVVDKAASTPAPTLPPTTREAGNA